MIIVAFGANMAGIHGAPLETYSHALAALEGKGLTITARSSLWQTSPVGTADDQPWYTNAVLNVETDLKPQEVLALLMSVEAQFGRIRTTRNAARSIDLDLICYEDKIIMDAPDLILPHPRMHERGFVLWPLKEIAPHWTHPVTGAHIDDLIAALPTDQKASRVAEEAA